MSSVKRVSELEQTLTNGVVDVDGTLMFNDWKIMHDIETLTALVDMIVAKEMILPGSVIFGMSTRGVPLATLLAYRTKSVLVPVVKTVRLPEHMKQRGTSTGQYKTADFEIALDCIPDDTFARRGFIVDDCVATGGSVDALRDMLRHTHPHFEVNNVFCLFHLTDISSTTLRVHAAFEYSAAGLYLGVGSLYHSALVCQHAQRAIPYKRPLVFFAPALASGFLDHPNAYPIPDKYYVNGVPNFRFPGQLNRAKVTVYLDLQERARLMDSILFCKILPAQNIKSLTIQLPYYPDGTNERVSEEGIVASAHTVALMFHNMQATRTGPPVVVLNDLHAVTTRHYFDNTVRVEMRSFLGDEPLAGTVVFPDDGAHKRYGHLATRYVVMVKRRVGDARVVNVLTWAGAGSLAELLAGEITLVDDLFRTGATILATLAVLEQNGARPGSVSVKVPFMDPEGDAAYRFFAKTPACFKQLYCTPFTNAGRVLLRTRGDVRELFADDIPAHRPPRSYHMLPAIVVGSTNAAKIAATRATHFVDVPSGVPAQPTAEEAVRGAAHRAKAAEAIWMAKHRTGCFFGVEHGVDAAFKEHVAYAMRVRRAGYDAEDNGALSEKCACEPVGFVVPEEFRGPLAPGETYGKRIRAARGLASDDAWLGDRQAVIESVLCKVLNTK